jgi:uncharacterized protein
MAARGRPACPRVVRNIPNVTYFKPRGVPMQDLDLVVLSLEELEAISLVDMQDLEQEDAAARMNVSRRTLARELHSGRKKIADALLNGKAIEIKGGNYKSLPDRLFSCADCMHEWKQPSGTCRPCACPKCSGKNVCVKK